MAFTPSDLADIIGITTAPDGHHSNLPSQQQIQRMKRADSDEWVQNGSFWLEFAASYLPSFFRTYFSTDFDLEGGYFSKLTCHFAHMGLGESFPRFARAFPDELGASFDVQLRRIASLVQIGLNRPDTPANLSLAFALSAFHHSAEAYFIHQIHEEPSSHPFVAASTEVRDLLRSQLARVRSIGVTSFHMDGNVAANVLVGRWYLLEIIKSGSVKMQEKGGEPCCLYDKVWWKCDIESASEPLDSDVAKTPCSGPDDEMRFCARCKAVRYCSRDHQRLRWKIHKKYCFEPSW